MLENTRVQKTRVRCCEFLPQSIGLRKVMGYPIAWGSFCSRPWSKHSAHISSSDLYPVLWDRSASPWDADERSLYLDSCFSGSILAPLQKAPTLRVRSCSFLRTRRHTYQAPGTLVLFSNILAKLRFWADLYLDLALLSGCYSARSCPQSRLESLCGWWTQGVFCVSWAISKLTSIWPAVWMWSQR